MPVNELHVMAGSDGNPEIVLEETTGQKWEIQSFNDDFEIQDVNASFRVPFKIENGADTHTLVVADTSRVGIGTNAPDAALHVVEGTNSTAVRDVLKVENKGEGRIIFENTITGVEWRFGMANPGVPDSFNISKNFSGGNEFQIRPDGRVQIGLGSSVVFDLRPNGDLTIDGTLTELSSREAKENFAVVDDWEVLARLEALPIATWNYKAGSPEERHMGPVAEDFHAAFGLGADDRHIAPKDIAGVALAAIKAQQAEISALRNQVSALEELVSRLLDGRG